jgi:uncharacterized RmlC-like cupin family protein/cold shock CspA family protein
MQTTGRVRDWHADLGWGVLDSPATPGGCWAHYSRVEMTGFRSLAPGAEVSFTFEAPGQDGFPFRAVTVWPASAAYTARLTIELDDPGRPVRVLRPADLVPADPTPGMDRQRAFELPLLWAGQVETGPGVVSGWHHHDLNDSSLYVVRGILRFEFAGHDGHLDAGPGDFVHVPSFTVHRESNPTDEPSLAVIARVGGGIPTVNVDAPPQPHGEDAR